MRRVLPLATLVLLPLSMAAIFLYAPTERVQGHVQRIFYLHLPLAWVAYLAFFIVFLCSLLYLWRSSERWDLLGHAAAEVGVVFTTLVLITGSLWARPIWGTWWSWDARLTTTLVLWFIYVGYLMLRGSVVDDSRAARYAAVVGIIGFLDIPVIHQSVTWWRSLHPEPIVAASGGPAMPASMLIAVFINIAAFTLLYLCLLRMRTQVELLRRSVRRLRRRVLEGEV